MIVLVLMRIIIGPIPGGLEYPSIGYSHLELKVGGSRCGFGVGLGRL